MLHIIEILSRADFETSKLTISSGKCSAPARSDKEISPQKFYLAKEKIEEISTQTFFLTQRKNFLYLPKKRKKLLHLPQKSNFFKPKNPIFFPKKQILILT